jgi:ribulose 1,5-bisphosphate carboxylase large subunit-like protein
MRNIELTILTENADEKALNRFLGDLQKLKDLPSGTLEIDRRSPSSFVLKIGFPLSIFDRSVGQFMAVLFGEIPFMRAFGQARFEDLDLPEEVYEWFGGPAFGASVVLDRFDAADGPLLLAILKPSLDFDLTLDGLAKRISEPTGAGFHAAKDDEMQGNFPNLPVNARLDLASRNRRYIPALNFDDPADTVKILQRSEIGMVMVNGTILGFPVLHELRKRTKVPILSHLSMQGVYASSFSHRLYAQLHRLFGCDAFISPIGETHYYRASQSEEHEIVRAFTSDLPIARTLPLLTGGGSMENLARIMIPHETAGVPYGIVLGGLIFNSERTPAEMAAAVVEKVAQVKASLASAVR